VGGTVEVRDSVKDVLNNADNVSSANVFGLINGGTGGPIWMYIGTFIGFFAAIVSMAEMASM